MTVTKYIKVVSIIRPVNNNRECELYYNGGIIHQLLIITISLNDEERPCTLYYWILVSFQDL